ncbi:TPA: restriction endonuclease subunit S [Elizabethkingia anophelis]|uniref:restriction endonuclease subunit S n=1 Tax=Elizabethkingia anophelis TaxID=1117645 RepID=UPI00162647E9|nr:restriction endonuclease subunit S [Elizabethkingia anophelis]MCT4322157.1 restriction endonuclease subunit S [Elizabethkingia anophelis]HAY3534554.1 restriction endonuclease subunit S [Elizabethkingia anophelis]HAY3591458.1 restriction endonuclease subunit S [Elizabethkingia anophelis]
MTEENKSVKKFPNLRFPGFENEWEVKKLGDVCEINPKNSTLPNSFVYIDLESVIDGVLIKENKITSYEAPSRAQRILRSEDILFQMVRPYQKNNFFFNLSGNYVASTGYAQIRTIQNPRFIFQYLHNQKFVDKVIERCTGTSYPAINSTDLSEINLSVPLMDEQEKISSFLFSIDKRIQTQRKIIEGLITLKIQSRNKLFKRIIKDDYEAFTVEEILNYEQPTKYIVSNTDYSSDKSLIPVLTANKAFILGYTNEDWGIYNKGKCIVLDDFTLDLKYVDFSFKIKSSAIKLLTPKNNVDLKFVFEYFSFLNLSSNEHKRHYISEIQPMLLNIPAIDIQNNISNFLSKLDSKISLETELLTQYENQKKYLLQNLFV